MTTTTERAGAGAAEREIVTFYIDDLHLGLPIDRVQEINRDLDTTPVPQAPGAVRGVVNLRGEVVTVLDLRSILGLPVADGTVRERRNVIVTHDDEKIGLVVDRVGDVVRTAGGVDRMPSNMSQVDARFFDGVFQTSEGLLAILDPDVVLALDGGERAGVDAA